MHNLSVRIILSEFWILRGRQAIKKVICKCLPCKIMQANSCTQIEAPLPADRIIPAPPFTTTGIDFAGPVYVRRSKSSSTAYIALFTCSVTRALHIELMSDLSTDNFLLALQRFVGRRGLPQTIYTDNATTFQAANKELAHLWNSIASAKVQQFYAHNGIKWKFIVPRAAWWGGWWERLIGSVKRCLRKILGRALLTEEQLSTVLIGVEAALNSRPLTNDDSSDSLDSALTPSHFLIGQKLTLIPSNPEGEKRELTRVFKQQQDLLKIFWNKWSREYLLQLRSFHEVKNVRKTAKIAPGDLVLLNEEVRPRHMWKRGRILNIIEGRDGKPRACTIRVGSGTQITRPLQLVIPLEIDQGGEDVEKSDLMTS